LPSPKVENLDPNKAPPSSPQKKTPTKHERPLKCLETLAQKAGITFDEKYEMEKSQSPQVQQMQQNTHQAALQITQEQYQQLQQQLQLQAFANSQPTTIHVKQEFQQQQQQQPQGITAADLKQLQDHQMQQMQIVQQDASQSPHAANSQAAQAALQQAVQNGQVPAEWQQQRVQVLQQPLQNTQYLQQQLSYPQLVMSGNLIHGGLGQQQQFQLIAAGKPLQNQLTQQMLSAGGKSVQSFGGYTMPSIPTSQSQAVIFSPVNLNNVINSQQQQASANQQILPNLQSQQTPTKSENKPIQGKNILQKTSQAGPQQQQQSVTGTVGNQQNMQSVQVSQTMPTAQLLNGQTMQFASPWIQAGAMPFWNGLQQPIQLTSPILIRGTNPDGTPTFIQQSPTQNAQQTVLSSLNRKCIKYN
jgi:polyhomeotic-like protein 1